MQHKIHKIINKLTLWLSTILGLFWVIYVLYRIFQFELVITFMQPVVKLFLLFSIILLSISLSNKLKESQIIKYILKITDIIYWKPLNSFFDTMIKPIPGIGDVLMWIGATVLKYKNNKRIVLHMKLVYLFTDLVPRLFLVFAFFIDIIFNNSVFYLKYLIPIFLPYLISFRLLIYILNDFSLFNKNILDTYLIKNIITTADKRIEVFTLRPEKAEKHKQHYKLYVERYFLFDNMHKMVYVYNAIRNELNSPITENLIKVIYLVGTIKLLFSLYGIVISYTFSVLILYYVLLYILFFYKNKL